MCAHGPILQAEAIQKGLAFHLNSSLVLWQNNYGTRRNNCCIKCTEFYGLYIFIYCTNRSANALPEGNMNKEHVLLPSSL